MLFRSTGGTVTLAGVNTAVSDVVVDAGTLALADNEKLNLAINDLFATSITGTGTVALDGDFGIDLSLADLTPGNTWTLVAASTLTETFGPNFSIPGFTGGRSLWQLTRRRIDKQRWLIELSDRTTEADVSRAHTDFVANASHELRTPLASIIGYVETLEDDKAGSDAETRKRFDAGMSDDEAARDIAFDAFRDWIDGERIFINVNALYREFTGDTGRPDAPRLFGLMAFGKAGCSGSRSFPPCISCARRRGLCGSETFLIEFMEDYRSINERKLKMYCATCD